MEVRNIVKEVVSLVYEWEDEDDDNENNDNGDNDDTKCRGESISGFSASLPPPSGHLANILRY